MASRRWTLYVCDECGEEGHEFRTAAPCYPEKGTHRGKHGGPVQVMPVSDALATLEEAVAELEKRGEEADKVASESTDTPMFSIPYAHRGECNREAASLLRTHLDRLRGEGE